MSHFTDAQPPMLFLALSAALMALTVSYSVDAEPLSESASETSVASYAPPTMPFEPPTLAPSAIVLGATPAYRMEEGVVKFYFAPSKTDIPLSAERALHEIAASIHNGQRVQISGFHDSTGNAQQNIALSKKRAEVVQQRLIALGAPAKAIEVKKPAVAVTTQDHAEARRVEVALLR
ncbi:MAG TPA: OmpA family protein [Comamonas sp.]